MQIDQLPLSCLIDFDINLRSVILILLYLLQIDN
jgi:hypothetical protein